MGDDVGARRQVRAVAVHRALRISGRPRRVDDRRGVLGRQRPHQLGERVGLAGQRVAAEALDLGQRAHARVPVHEQRSGVDHQHDANAWALVQHREGLVEVLLVLGHHERRAAVLEEMAHFAGRAGRIDPVGDRAERLRRQIGDRPLRARVADDRHRLAARHAVLAREAHRDCGHALRVLAPRRLAPHAELLRAIRDAVGARLRLVDEQPGQRAGAQRAEIHAGRIIPEGIILRPS